MRAADAANWNSFARGASEWLPTVENQAVEIDHAGRRVDAGVLAPFDDPAGLPGDGFVVERVMHLARQVGVEGGHRLHALL